MTHDDMSRLTALVDFIETKEREWQEAEQQILFKINQIKLRSPEIQLPPVLSEMLRKQRISRDSRT